MTCPCKQEINRWIHKRDEAIDSIRKHVIRGGIDVWIEVFGHEHTFNEIERAKADILVEMKEPKDEQS